MWGLSGLHTDKADAYHLVLLRTSRKRPRSRRTAEQRDEFAPSYVKHGNFLPAPMWA